MDFAQALNELWNRRGWVLVGAFVALAVAISTAYDLRLNPLGLQGKALPIATAGTNLLVDTPDSAITDLSADLGPLVDRAIAFGRLGVSQQVRRDIARRVGVRERDIAFASPLEGEQRPQSTRDRRITSILEGNRDFQVAFVAERGLPNIRVQTQAPEVRDALRLADESAKALIDYIADIQRRQGRPVSRRVVLRQLSAPAGGVIAAEINRQLLVLSFVATFIAWCLLMLLTMGVVRNVRALRRAEAEAEAEAAPAAAPPPASRERLTRR